MRFQPAVLKHQFNDFTQGQAAGLLTQHVELGSETTQVGAGLARHRAHRIPQRATRGVGDVLQLFDAARPDAARRDVDDAHEAGVVVRVLQQPQVGQRVFDLGALKKPQTAIHPVGHTGVEQRGFHHPALRVAAVQQRDFLAHHAVPHQLPDFVDKPLRLGKVAGGLVHAHRLTRPGFRAQVFAQAVAVVADEFIGGVQDVAKAAVVALQLDLVGDPELPHKVCHVADTRPPKCVDALVVVAHSHHRATGQAGSAVRPLPREHLDPGVLQLVGVLELIDQDVAKAPLVVLAHRLVVTQQLEAAQHQLAKVHHAFTLALRLVQGINLDFLAHFLVARRQILGALAIFLAPGDEVHQLFRGEPLIVHIELFAQAFDAGQLVLGVQNLKRGRQAGQLVVRSQEAVAQAVKGANPHAAHIDREHGLQPHQHFLGGLVGEGDGQNTAGRHLAGLKQPGDAGRQHPGFARTRPGQDERVRRGQRDRRVLLGVKIL